SPARRANASISLLLRPVGSAAARVPHAMKTAPRVHHPLATSVTECGLDGAPAAPCPEGRETRGPSIRSNFRHLQGACHEESTRLLSTFAGSISLLRYGQSIACWAHAG